ncbi:hypothetical protein D3C76_421690 [compost metagenome]
MSLLCGFTEISPLTNNITSQLKAALEAHSLGVAEHNGALSVEEGRLELEANVFDHAATSTSSTVVLEVQARSDQLAGQPIVECFAGVGESRDQAIADAFGKMLLGTFHVLIEGLTSHSCPEELAEIEHWQNDDSDWTVFSGPLLTMHSGDSTLNSTYPAFISQLTSLFVATVPPGPHWVRVFLCAYDDQVQAVEVLLDNEPWEQGQSLLAAQSWSCTPDYQSIRHFILALPDSRGRD